MAIRYIAVEPLSSRTTGRNYQPGDVVDTAHYTPDDIRIELELNMIRAEEAPDEDGE